MWLDAVLVGLLLLQLVLLALAAWQIRRLRRDLTGQANAGGGVPALLIISTLNKIEHRMDGLDDRLQRLVEQGRRGTELALSTAMAAAAAHTVPITDNYELAQQLARQGCELDVLMQRCNLSRSEAELIQRLYAGRS